MNREELQAYINGLGASLTFEEGGEWLNLLVEPLAFRELMLKLRTDDQLVFDYMFCLTCVDWKTHLTMVYHLSSTRYRYNIVVKSKLDRTTPEIETICDIAVIMAINGARLNIILSAPAGVIPSFISNFTVSASDCSMPL